MPVYEYACSHCEATFELMQNVNARPPRTCPECGERGGVKKQVSAPAFQFKGTGWYVTDYADKKKKAGGKETKSSESKDSSDSDAKTSDTKDSSSDKSDSSSKSKTSKKED